MFCNYCKRDNHTEDKCFKKQREQSTSTPTANPVTPGATANVALLCYDACLLSATDSHNITRNTFVSDAGASTHMVHSKDFLTKFKEDDGTVKIGDNS